MPNLKHLRRAPGDESVAEISAGLLPETYCSATPGVATSPGEKSLSSDRGSLVITVQGQKLPPLEHEA
ncbi:hypothetical protein RvY_14756 [Ramazzottius varieornatus]|uniref:Uncharacterized protein n=1 Tax=Ramazzottius varieornatus TaxID=947166 RepID=A0A1D1VU93_RAMVA|nr:hypothetical protein RvY_14756 [Ramazzottius varieornatus]